MAYNAEQHASPKKRLELIRTLSTALRTHKDTKRDVPGGRATSKRAKALNELIRQVREQKQALASLRADKVTSPTGVLTVAEEIHLRAVRVAQNMLAERRGGGGMGAFSTMNAEAVTLKKKAKSVSSDPLVVADAERAADGLYLAVAGYRAIVSNDSRSLKVTYRSLKKHWQEASDSRAFLAAMSKGLQRLEAVAAKDADKKEEWGFLDDDRLEFVNQFLALSESGTDIGGYHGTEGKGNEGFQEYGSKFAPKGADDKLSGGMDMAGGVAKLGTDGIALFKALRTWTKRPKADPADRRAALVTMVNTPLSMFSSVMKIQGGAATAAKGYGAQLADTAVTGFDSTKADLSTDFKFAGDLVGVLSGVFMSITKVFDFFKHNSERSAKQKGKSTRKKVENVGLVAQKGTGVLVSFANNAKSVMKLYYQIQGAGQVGANAVSEGAKVFMGKIVPALSILTSVIEVIRLIYKMVRLDKHAGQLVKKISALMINPKADLPMVEAVEFARVAVGKRMHRVGINIGHALTGIVSGALATSGIGMAPGLIIGLADTATMLGQFTVRAVKQNRRDAKAKHRAKKDKARGKTETWEQFKVRKRLETADKGPGARFKTATMLTFKYNWDKSSANKKSTTTAVALEMLRMNDPEIFKAVGISGALADERAPAERLKIVVSALNKRD